MQLVKQAIRERLGALGSVLAMTAALVGAPVLSAQETPAQGPAAAPEDVTPNASEPAASAAAPIAKGLTLEQMQAAMVEAERRQAEAMRPDPSVPKAVTDQWGVEIIRVASAADGFWLDFRFRVTDVQKALPLFDSRIKPYLQSDQSGVKLAVPSAAKVGALRTTNRGGNIKPDKIYAIMFANPGRHVKPGQKVSVVIGDFKVEHLTVN